MRKESHMKKGNQDSIGHPLKRWRIIRVNKKIGGPQGIKGFCHQQLLLNMKVVANQELLVRKERLIEIRSLHHRSDLTIKERKYSSQPLLMAYRLVEICMIIITQSKL
jgi:hypothetical protein